MTNVGKLMYKNRIKQNVTQQMLSDHLGYSTCQYISNIECGKCSLSPKKFKPTIELLKIKKKTLLSAAMNDFRNDLRGKSGF